MPITEGFKSLTEIDFMLKSSVVFLTLQIKASGKEKNTKENHIGERKLQSQRAEGHCSLVVFTRFW